MGMPLIVDSFSCSEQVSQKTSPFISLLEENGNPYQMQLLNGRHTTEPFLRQQISTYHRNGILSISKTQTVESQPFSKPIDFSVIVSPTKRNCSSVLQNGHPVDFTRSEEEKSRIGSRVPRNGSSTFKKSYVEAVDLTADIMIDVNRNKVVMMSKIFHLQGLLAYPLRTPQHVQRLYMPPQQIRKFLINCQEMRTYWPPNQRM